MLTLVLAVTAPACLLAWCASGPERPEARSGPARQRWLRRHPHLVTYGDIHCLLAVELGRETVIRVVELARQRAVAPRLLMACAENEDVALVALALAAGADRPQFERHLAGVTPFDRDTLTVFAAWAEPGLALPSPADKPSRPGSRESGDRLVPTHQTGRVIRLWPPAPRRGTVVS